MELRYPSLAISDGDYEFLQRLVYEQSRIQLGPDKRPLVTSRLAKRLRQLGLPDCGAYCRLLRSPAGPEELRHLIDRISTNHTQFFREIKHFDFLRDRVLPAWKSRPNRDAEPFRIWSAACSSGEEPYSLAVTLSEHLGPPSSGAWQIDASDISTRVLETARTGVYPAERLTTVPQECLRRYFQRGVQDKAGLFRVKEPLRNSITFHHLNLLQPGYPFSRPFQVIFCRNVMIYFDRQTQEELIGHLVARLVPGGYLMVGHSESLSGIRHPLKSVQPAVYLKS